MGTKEKPGAFDGYAAAEPDEPLFVLKSTDESAPTVVRIWAELYRERKMKARRWNEPAVRRYIEALETANAMAAWRHRRSGSIDEAVPFMVPPSTVALGEMTPPVYFGAGSQAARVLDGMVARGMQSEPPVPRVSTTGTVELTSSNTAPRAPREPALGVDGPPYVNCPQCGFDNDAGTQACIMCSESLVSVG